MNTNWNTSFNVIIQNFLFVESLSIELLLMLRLPSESGLADNSKKCIRLKLSAIPKLISVKTTVLIASIKASINNLLNQNVNGSSILLVFLHIQNHFLPKLFLKIFLVNVLYCVFCKSSWHILCPNISQMRILFSYCFPKFSGVIGTV